MEDMEHEVVNFYTRERFPVENKEGNHSTLKTYNPEFVLIARGAGAKREQRLREWPTNDWPNLSSILCP